ncbi:MAG: glutamyl-tRNA reductase [Acidobacteria bacterium]|nr:glutamyl-tRNA reductase [Acidobacteriota bacterium]
MKLVLVGLNHRTAPVEIRQRVAFPEDGLQQALQELMRSGMREALILSTCNRVEVLANCPEELDGEALLKQFLYAYHSLAPPFLERHLYSHLNDKAVRHIFRVASSLDSMVVGETQILGQVKEAYSLACQAGTVGNYLHSVMNRAFSVAKRARSETGISAFSVSISSVAVELAKKIFGELGGRTLLILGAGKMGELALKHLRSSGVSQVWVTNRTPERAQELAASLEGVAVPFERLQECLRTADIVISSTGAPGFVLTRQDVQKAILDRGRRPIFFIDISVPRNVDPEVHQIENVYYYDIDNLQTVSAANRREREREARLAERLVEEEVKSFASRLKLLNLAPTIAGLRSRIERICQEELERSLRKLSDRTPQHEEELRLMTARIVNKICHPLISQMKRQDENLEFQMEYIETIKRMFRLNSKL